MYYHTIKKSFRLRQKVRGVRFTSYRDKKTTGGMYITTKIKIGTLGPDGSNSAIAAKNWCKKTGRNTDNLIYYNDIADVVFAVETGEIDFGVVPIENMLDGSVTDTLDILEEYQVETYDEVYVKIRHCLSVKDKNIPISVILSHPKALAQCRKNLKLHYPGVALIPTTSTSAAAASASNTDGVAAIAPREAAEKFGLTVLDENIQDKKENYTRFVVISNRESFPSGNDKTSIIVYPCENKTGVLYEIIGEFAKRNIDLTMVETRPTKEIFGEYIFHIDLKGHRKDLLVQEALDSVLERGHILKILGSYPAAKINGA